jgi:hypothetical protein
MHEADVGSSGGRKTIEVWRNQYLNLSLWTLSFDRRRKRRSKYSESSAAAAASAIAAMEDDKTPPSPLEFAGALASRRSPRSPEVPLNTFLTRAWPPLTAGDDIRAGGRGTWSSKVAGTRAENQPRGACFAYDSVPVDKRNFAHINQKGRAEIYRRIDREEH